MGDEVFFIDDLFSSSSDCGCRQLSRCRPDAFDGGFEVDAFRKDYLQTNRLSLSVLSLNSSGAMQLQQYLHGNGDDPSLQHVHCHRLFQ
jgi:hypothetical protein